MTLAIKEYKGFIVVTTFSSALADDVVVNIIEKNITFINFDI
tara:strand:- start:514 stop:639 length:126 start_codon:yes stop_codon:yes gene_type:complete